MILDQRVHYTLAPLVLRLALAVIFIYHGNLKVFGTNTELGAAWAEAERTRQSAIPRDVLDRMQNAPTENAEAKSAFMNSVAKSYSENSPVLPATLNWHAAQYAVAWGELLGGVALLVGLLTRVAALGLIIIQLGAIATVTAGKGFSFAAGGGYEYNIALIAMCLALVIMGGGTWAVDRFFRRTTTHQEAAAQQQSKVTVHA
jgi:uncharacterized membrane protein YphA (DoxX/SURF4 family)